MDHKNADVFISYSRSIETVEKVCAALEEADISCWYAPRDVEGPFAASIISAISSCKVFLLILNQQSATSQHVLNEIHSAFDRYSREEEISIIPFKLEECTLSPSTYYYIARQHMMDGSLPPEEARTRELIARIQHTLDYGNEMGKLVQLPSMPRAKEYRLKSVTEYPSTDFVGRQEELRLMREKLGKRNKLFLQGMGGMGKSELAKTYCEIYQNEYDIILWTCFSDSLVKTLSSDHTFPIGGLSRQDFPEDEDLAYSRRKLDILKELADERVLIVLDNFDVENDPLLKEFCAGSYSVLFTTRMKQRLPQFERH